jgi:hypothetical protein
LPALGFPPKISTTVENTVENVDAPAELTSGNLEFTAFLPHSERESPVFKDFW